MKSANLAMDTNENHNPGTVAGDRLAQSISARTEECILRVRRGAIWWEGSNRTGPVYLGVGPLTRAFRTASVTKTFTATLVLLLVEDGIIDLGNTLSDYLPSEICDRVHVLDGISYGPQITVAQLLRHRSGLFDYATDGRFAARIASNPARKWSPLDLLNEAIDGRTPYFRPDQGVAYSDTGYVLLGLIIEAVTGTPLAVAYRQRLLAPLGLDHTYLEGREPAADWPVSHAYAGSLNTAGLDPSFDTFGGGGLISTAANLDRFITALLSGKVFADKTTLDLMMQGTEEPAGTGTRKIRTAAGVSAYSVNEHRFWGHLGHWHSFMLYSPEQDIAICGTLNQADEDPGQKRVLEIAAADAMGWQA